MLILSPIVSKWSGSLAGIVGSHNKGGMYLRQRSTPINPNTSFQQAIRNAVKLFTADWTDVLTSVQRDAWEVYAQNQPLTNTLGESRQIPPLAHYVRSNVSRDQAGLTRVDDAPVLFTLPTFTDPSFAVTGSTGAVSVTFDDADDWANEDGGALLLYGSRPQSAGINFFNGPYRFLDVIEGDAITPPTSPFAATSPFLGTTGSKYFFFVRVSRADGRLSSERFYFDIAA